MSEPLHWQQTKHLLCQLLSPSNTRFLTWIGSSQPRHISATESAFRSSCLQYWKRIMDSSDIPLTVLTFHSWYNSCISSHCPSWGTRPSCPPTRDCRRCTWNTPCGTWRLWTWFPPPRSPCKCDKTPGIVCRSIHHTEAGSWSRSKSFITEYLLPLRLLLLRIGSSLEAMSWSRLQVLSTLATFEAIFVITLISKLQTSSKYDFLASLTLLATFLNITRLAEIFSVFATIDRVQLGTAVGTSETFLMKVLPVHNQFCV